MNGQFQLVQISLVLAVLALTACTPEKSRPQTNSSVQVSNLASLVELSPDALAQLDIARVNLLCAESLPGAEHLIVANSLAVIDQMAARVRSETERHLYRYQRNPAEFENSEGCFRMIMLMVVLAEDFQVHYATNKIASAASVSMGDGFFADPQDVFLHGLTGANHRGTCSSLPVLQVAVVGANAAGGKRSS